MKEISDILDELSSKRVEITPFLYERFVNGSPDRVLEAIADQVNGIFDYYDTTLTNVFHEITNEITELRRTIRKLSEEAKTTCRKGQHLPRNTR